MKIDRRARTDSLRKYDLNTRFFSIIDSESKAYWLGFIIADGAIVDTKISVKLAAKDGNHLIKLQKCLNTNKPIETGNSVRNGKSHSFCALNISSKDMVSDLKSHGVECRKTLRERFPSNLSPSLERHFLRGLFDGDGCIKVLKYGNLLTYCGSQNIVIGFRDLLVNYLGVVPQKLRKQNSLFYISFGRQEDTQKILKYLYGDSVFFLDRKYMQFSSICHL